MDLTQRLSTNSPPKHCEVVVLNSRIQDLASFISQMEVQLQTMKDELKRHRDALSAIRRIPQEILGEIFLYTCPSEQQVITFGLVCKTWRSATLSTHRLWSRVSICNSRNLGSSCYEKIIAWFGRAGAIPNELRFSEDDANVVLGRCIPGSCHMLNPTVHRLLTEGPRVDGVSLLCKGPFCLRRLLNALNAPSPIPKSQERPWDCIRSLDIEFDYFSTWVRRPALDVKRQETLFLQLPPSITSFTLQLPNVYGGFSYPENSSMIDLNVPPNLLERLTYFKLVCNWDGSHVLSLLEHCQNIETLEIDLGFRRSCIWYDDADGPLLLRVESGIHLPKLQTFRLFNSPDLDLLHFLVSPSVRTLDLQLQGDDDENISEGEIYTSLHNFIARGPGAQKTLHNLRLHGASLTVKELADTLRELGSLKQLTLDTIEVDVIELFRVLLRGAGPSAHIQASGATVDDICLPDLEVLQLLNIPVPDAPSLYPIFDFLTRRGPHQCHVVFSFQVPRRVPQEKDLRDSWPQIVFLSDDEGDRGPSTLRGHGVSISVVPPTNQFEDGF